MGDRKRAAELQARGTELATGLVTAGLTAVAEGDLEPFWTLIRSTAAETAADEVVALQGATVEEMAWLVVLVLGVLSDHRGEDVRDTWSAVAQQYAATRESRR